MTRIPSEEMAFELAKLAYGKASWLSDFSDGRNKRPSHDIDRVRKEKAVLEQARDDYRASAERRGAA